jgi:putative FmdB family regulatory protein
VVLPGDDRSPPGPRPHRPEGPSERRSARQPKDQVTNTTDGREGTGASRYTRPVMPTYEYTCRSCGHTFDVVQAMSDEPLTVCPECGGELRKVFGAPAISFKGSGFYATDHGKKSKTSSEKSGEKSGENSGEKSGEKPAASTESSDSKSEKKDKKESKPAEKPAASSSASSSSDSGNSGGSGSTGSSSDGKSS